MLDTRIRQLNTLGNVRIVIADDDPVLLRLLRLFLKPLDFDIVTVVNGRQLLDDVIQTPPDFILTDIDMPLLNGLDAVREIRRQLTDIKPGLPIVVMSVAGNQKDCLDAGANLFVQKPIMAKKLYELLIDALIQDSADSPVNETR